MLLLAVTMTAINLISARTSRPNLKAWVATYHDLLRQSSLDKFLATLTDEITIEVGTLASATKDDMHVGIALTKNQGDRSIA
jgi:hypothetical protein